MEKTDFEILLDRIEVQYGKMKSHMEAARWFWKNGNTEAALERAMKLEELSEKYILNCRALPLYTDKPQAKAAVDRTIAECIPVQMGYTKEGWFCLQIPALLPKKDRGSAEYVRGFLYPAMDRFFTGKPRAIYPDAVLCYRHVYNRARPERQWRDHDNIEINMVSDTVAMHIMKDDGAAVCWHFYCSAPGSEDRTEVYVVPQNELRFFLELLPSIGDEGVKLHETKV